MKIKDITLGNYLKLSDTRHYDFWADKIPAKNMLNGKKGKDKHEWTFNEVTYIRTAIADFELDTIKKLYDICFSDKKILNFTIKKKQIEKLSLFEIIQWWRFLINEIEEINEYEQALLSDTDPTAIQAGINQMGKFGYLNTTVPIAERFKIDPDVIGEWKWVKVFNLAHYYKTKSEIDRRYLEIKSKLK